MKNLEYSKGKVKGGAHTTRSSPTNQLTKSESRKRKKIKDPTMTDSKHLSVREFPIITLIFLFPQCP